ncbi:efflux RND transporter periplasmic adaptor subunit [Dysgonomonas sp. 521]|uniref:efflux RND transporter periplasmic adaptor subunit n=1 Tax=Dysgonomonas sp. 521 TaxID=2302932 RepID=UPI0013D7F9E3|nr:efflux RND transporter periplasmic adaptor subunit [Dysgonomonas sp. 521]NDV97531.1 efflux RND transporter periplasmic adaptor subunit [Dysgonomonas sp. 521]
MKVKNLYFLLLLSGIITLVSCQNKNNGEELLTYKLLEINPSNVNINNSYSASIKGKQDIKIIPNVSGYLNKVCITEGSRVKAGQVLFVIDQIPYIAALQGARANVSVCEANVSTARLNYDSKQNLYNKKVVSEFDLLSAENALKTAIAQLELAKSQKTVAENSLSYTVIKSPSDGVVGKIPYRFGDYVSPTIQDGLTIVADDSEMYAYFSMAENQILDLLSEYKNLDNAIANLPEVELQLGNKTMYEYKGRIESISGVIDAQTGSVSIKAVFPNSGKALLSGGTGNVIMPYQRNNIIIIPQESTYEIQNKVYAYKVIDGVAKSTVITVAKVNDNRNYIVESGLQPGDIIIAEGAGLVKEGSQISTITNKEKE